MIKDTEILSAKINLETARIPWRELQRFFAQGRVLIVDSDQDLVAVARNIADDRAGEIKNLIEASTIRPVDDKQAKAMIEHDSLVWAVVIAPWVLIQQIRL